MTSFRLRIIARTLPFLLIAPGLALAQTAPTRGAATAALNQPAKPGAAQYTRQQIDQMIAPIALYPDQLLSQVLMAASYPQQVVEAAQWAQDPSHAEIKGDALVSALEPLPWDPSVKALVAFPQIIALMSEHIEWTEALGVAFVTQQSEVMARVQALRHLAMKSGKLGKVRHLKVREEGEAIVITETEPGKIFVPIYNPTVVYGAWPDQGFPPVFIPPPQGFVAETIEPGLEVSIGYAVVAPLWGWSRPDWREQRITVNRAEYTRITHNVEVGPGDSWRHAGPVVLVAPTAASRTTVTTTKVPAGSVAPAKAAAVVALPQRAAADPARIKTHASAERTGTEPTQTTTNRSGSTEPNQTQTTTDRPSTTPPGKNQANTTEPAATRPGQTQATTPNSATSEPGKTGSATRESTSGQKTQPSGTEANTGKPNEHSARHPESAGASQSREEGKSAPPSANRMREAAPANRTAAKPAETTPGKSQEQAKNPAGSQQMGGPEHAGSSMPNQTGQERNRAAERNGGAATPGRDEQSRVPERGGSSTQPEAQHPARHAPDRAAAQPSAASQTPGSGSHSGQAEQNPPSRSETAGHGSSTPPAAAEPHQAPAARRGHEPAGSQPGQSEEKDKKER